MTASRTYLDYNATAPLRPEARAAMIAALDVCGNPSSVHWEGRRARQLVEAAREQLAALVGATPAEIVFTSGATEANAWAIANSAGLVAASATEHASVLASLPVTRTMIPVSRDGIAEITGINMNAESKPRLIALQMANNETGVIQPVAKVCNQARDHGVHVHTDAVQAAGRIPVDFASLGAATMSLSSHKLGGPMGLGALVISAGHALAPLIPGGGQERSRRGGTENVAAIAGFGAAAQSATADLAKAAEITKRRDDLEAALRAITPNLIIVGENAPRLPNTSCIALAGQTAETLVIKFDLAGIAVSAGSACSSGKVGQSHVLAAMGLAPEVARSAIRVSLGPSTTDQDIAAFVAAWKRATAAGALAA